MWRDDDAGQAETGSSGGDPCPVWDVIGSDRAVLGAHVQSLAHFGVRAQIGEASATPSPITPVLCDGRNRVVVRGLLDATPARTAALLVFGINVAQVRAALLLAGVDDVVSPRIVPYELAARMLAAQRSRAAASGIIRLAGFTFDTGLRQVCWHGEPLPLMPREFDLLLVLARHAGLPVSRDALLNTVWRTAFDPGTNSLEVHIFKLRQRLAVLGDVVRIDTVKRQGYRLVSAPQPRG
ncbi:winged helix-turn-helix domain-containing protein [Blastomonas sp.]|uniref:winged helix-turn-helix domain-containing protein n=1 Tax=Blastomonas sp. TaxID=1909299 RepID=UPI00391D49A3